MAKKSINKINFLCAFAQKTLGINVSEDCVRTVYNSVKVEVENVTIFLNPFRNEITHSIREGSKIVEHRKTKIDDSISFI